MLFSTNINEILEDLKSDFGFDNSQEKRIFRNADIIIDEIVRRKKVHPEDFATIGQIMKITYVNYFNQVYDLLERKRVKHQKENLGLESFRPEVNLGHDELNYRASEYMKMIK